MSMSPSPVARAPLPGRAATPAAATPAPVVATFGYRFEGTTTLRTLTRGSLPLRGRIAGELDVSTGTYVADGTLEPSSGRLQVLGFLPLTATIAITLDEPASGVLGDGELTATMQARVRVVSLKALGIIPLVTGGDCGTRDPAVITLRSVGLFDPTGTGGRVDGTYAIGPLAGCGPLGPFLTPFVAGAGNTVSVQLTPDFDRVARRPRAGLRFPGH